MKYSKFTNKMKKKNDIIEKVMLIVVGLIGIFFAGMLVISIVNMIKFIRIDYF